MLKWHKSDLENRMYCQVEGNKKIAMPRYYKDKIYTELERERIAFFAKIQNDLRDSEEYERLQKKYDGDWERVRVERDIHSFKKLYADAQKGRDKI
ncbi:replication initiation protein [Tortoise microvirus 89]|nr:replication initiation protein [Tortoise microvirus 89]